MTEQQQHLQQLLQQRSELEAIEYLTQVGVTLPEPEAEEAPAEVAETEVVAE